MTWKIWKNWNKRRSKNFNIYHEDFTDHVEPATDNDGKQFEVNGVKYYRFKSESVMPYSRYKMLTMFIKQVELNMNRATLSGFIDKIEQNISGERGQVNLTVVHQVIQSIKARIILTFEIETVYSYASVVYFNDTENLYEYDKKTNEQKIASWREANSVDFFYMRPMSELFGLKNISKQDLEDYIKVIREVTAQTYGTTEQ